MLYDAHHVFINGESFRRGARCRLMAGWPMRCALDALGGARLAARRRRRCAMGGKPAGPPCEPSKQVRACRPMVARAGVHRPPAVPSSGCTGGDWCGGCRSDWVVGVARLHGLTRGTRFATAVWVSPGLPRLTRWRQTTFASMRSLRRRARFMDRPPVVADHRRAPAPDDAAELRAGLGQPRGQIDGGCSISRWRISQRGTDGAGVPRE